MKNIIFDTSTIISLSTNNLSWTLKPLKKLFNGTFYITETVKQEIVDKPLKTKRFKLNAIMLKDYIEEDVLTVYKSNSKLKELTLSNLNLANNIFEAHNYPIRIIQLAEMEALTLYNLIDSSALAMDERTLRYLVESPRKLSKLLSSRLHKKISINEKNLKQFQNLFKNINIIRSTELMTTAFDLKILDRFITDKIIHKELKKEMLDGLLWGLKLHGAAISPTEINQILRLHGY